MTRHFIAGLQQNAGFPNQSFSIKPVRYKLPGRPSCIANINGYTGPDSAPYNIRHKFNSYEIVTTLTESISWQLLYAKNLLIAFELILTNRDIPPGLSSYSWLKIETDVAVGWFLKSWWNLDSVQLNLLQQQKISQDQPFVIATMMHGPVNYQQQGQASGSADQQAPTSPAHPIGYFNSHLYCDSGEGKGDPQQHRHTLSLNCFVHPCYGVCQLRPSSDSETQNSEETLTGFREARPGQNSCPHLANGSCFSCTDNFNPVDVIYSEQNTPFERLDIHSGIQAPFDSGQPSQGEDLDENSKNNCNPRAEVAIDLMSAEATYTIDTTGPLNHELSISPNLTATSDNLGCIGEPLDVKTLLKEEEITSTLPHTNKRLTTNESSQPDQSHPHLSQTGPTPAKDNFGQLICKVVVVRKDGYQQPCWTFCKNARAMSTHQSRYHRGQRTCELMVVRKNGQQRPCGKLCQNANALWTHKRRDHSGQQTCDETVVGKDGRLRPCGVVLKNALSMSCHKTKYHTGEKICDKPLVEEDGWQRPCGAVCKNAVSLSYHRRKKHTEQKTCVVTVIGEDGQPRPCMKVLSSSQCLSFHKKRYHSGQKTCDIKVIGEDNQQRPCGKVFKNTPSLSFHKKRYHSEKKTCDIELVGEDNQQRPCGRVLKSAYAQ